MRLLVFLAALLTTAALAQDPTLRPRRLSVTTQLVSLNISVTDHDGAPIRNLTPADFELLDDTAPQKILFADEHIASTITTSLSPTHPSPDVFTNRPTSPPNDALNIVLLDDQHTPVRDQSLVYSELRRFLSNIPPGAITAIFKAGTHLEIVCGFSADRDRLLACLDNHASWPQRPIPELNLDLNFQADNLRAINEYLGQYPGRKNVLWFSSAFGGYSEHRRNNAATDVSLIEEDALADAIQGTSNDGRHTEPVNNIVLFPFSPSGLTAPFSAANNHPSLNNPSGLYLTEMDELAEETGGKAFYNGNDFAREIRAAITIGSNFYTLAFRPADLLRGSTHRVEIHLLNHPGAHLYYRRTYRAAHEPPPVYTKLHPLPAALSHGSPDTTAILFNVQLAPSDPQPKLDNPATRLGQFAANLKHPVRYTITWSLDPATLPATGVAFTAVAYDSDGKLLNFLSEIRDTPPAPTHQQVIDLPRGSFYLRVNITTPTGVSGSTEFPYKIK